MNIEERKIETKDYEDRPETLLQAYKNSLKDQKTRLVNLSEIIMKSSHTRSSEEIQHMMLHLLFKVPFFSKLGRKLILSLCEKLEYVYYPEGENLMVEGEIGDKMFVIFSGNANVLIKNHFHNETR